MISTPILTSQITLPPRTLSSFLDCYPTTTPASTPSTTTSSFTTLATTNYPDTKPHEAINMHTRRNNNMVATRTTKPTLMTRLRGRNAKTRTVKTTTTLEPAPVRAAPRSRWGRSNRRTVHAQPVVHHRRHVSIGDKISGAMMKLKGSLTRRPGVKV